MQPRFSHAPSYGLDFSNSLDPWRDMKELWNEASAAKVAPVLGTSSRTLYVTLLGGSSIAATFLMMALFFNNHFALDRSDPITTGTSVLAIKYKDGVMLTADTLGACLPLSRWLSEVLAHR